MMSRCQVLCFTFRGSTNIDGVGIRGDGQGAKGKDIRTEERMKGDNRWVMLAGLNRSGMIE